MRRLLMLGMASLVACGTEPTPPPPPFAGKIIFSSNRADLSGTLALYAMNADGSAVQALPQPLAGGIDQADISPDGEQLVFNRGFALYTVRGNGADLRLVVPAGAGATRPRWSPDGQRLIYDANESGSSSDLWIAGQSGDQQTNLTNTPDYSEFAADWSPNGGELVYCRQPVDLSIPVQLWVINTDGSDPHLLLTDAENDLLNPAFSPDGAWITYVSGPGYFTDLRAVRPDGSGDHSIFNIDDGTTVDNPAWSPDGASLVFSYGFAIATIHADGTGLRVLVDSAFNRDPDWGPAIQP